VLVALIASIGSLVVAAGNLYWSSHKERMERERSAQVELSRHREPLLSAVDDLGNRINNIRTQAFLGFLETERRRLALLGTAYRFAQLLGWVEILYGTSGHLHLAADRATKGVANLIGWVAASLADDKFDRASPSDPASSRLMLWREEQRAVGELMRRDGETDACIGYSTFVNRYDKDFAVWLDPFIAALESKPKSSWTYWAVDSRRLDRMQALLACLLVRLDVDSVLVGWTAAGALKPTWIQPDRYRPVQGAEFTVPPKGKPVRSSQ
jgi:hypothetical protein